MRKTQRREGNKSKMTDKGNEEKEKKNHLKGKWKNRSGENEKRRMRKQEENLQKMRGEKKKSLT